ncbi:MAG TPA: phosphate ABC transporter substrate-binding protein PstS family protein [Syntrophomonadaceae bacterium]|nr:phosphate ABC transporter substrate-binding protein PstS family protein [Syntrophomonadaceae bacterium]
MNNKRNRRIASFIVLATLIIASVYLVGCNKSNDQTKTSDQTAALQGTLTIAGSTSVQPFSEVLAQNFMKKNPNVKVNVQGGGSAQGIAAATNGTAQIGSSSAELKPEQKGDLVITQIAMDGIAVIVNPSNPISDLKKDDIKNIFLGNTKNWKEVGGPDAVITVVSREEGSGTRTAFEELLLAKQPAVKTAIVQNSTGAVKTTISGDKNAIGYDSLASVDKSVKALGIDGVAANTDNVKNGTYRVSRPFLYMTKGQPQGLAKAFIDFVMSAEGQKILVDQGAISLK